ncbi:MAG: phasin family protein [Gammaproteobacteria bacterium]
MYEQVFDSPNEVSRKALEMGKELADINGKIVNSLFEKQVELLNTCVENSSQELDALKGVNSVNDAVAVNVELAQKNAAAVSKALSETYKVLQAAAESYNDLFVAGVKPVKAAGKKAA